MPRLSAEPIVTTAAEEQVLTRLVRAHTTPRKLAERARMILLAAAGTGVRDIARQLGVWPKTVRHWQRRWRSAPEAYRQRTTATQRSLNVWLMHRAPAPRRHSRPNRSARLSHWRASNRQRRATCR